jgi:hypothetical protein
MDGGNGSVVSVGDMNEEWMTWALQVAVALNEGMYFTALDRVQKLEEELQNFTDQLRKTKGL